MQQQSTETSLHGNLSFPQPSQEDVHKIDEEFFCKCNISSKINNILRSPQTHMRQKSVFTANPQGTSVSFSIFFVTFFSTVTFWQAPSKFNVCAKPFISSTQSSAKEYLQQTSPPSGNNHHSPLGYIQSPPYSYSNRAIRTVPSRVMYPYDDDLCRIVSVASNIWTHCNDSLSSLPCHHLSFQCTRLTSEAAGKSIHRGHLDQLLCLTEPFKSVWGIMSSMLLLMLFYVALSYQIVVMVMMVDIICFTLDVMIAVLSGGCGSLL